MSPKVDFNSIDPENRLAVKVMRRMRQDRITTFTELKEITGITYSFIQDIFKNPENVNPSHKISSEKLAKYLDLPVEKVYELAGSIQPVDVTEDRAAYCAYVRQKFQLTRRDASLLFGLGKSAFGSIELGIREPSLTLLMLLRLLEKHPKLLDEIKVLAKRLG